MSSSTRRLLLIVKKPALLSPCSKLSYYTYPLAISSVNRLRVDVVFCQFTSFLSIKIRFFFSRFDSSLVLSMPERWLASFPVSTPSPFSSELLERPKNRIGTEPYRSHKQQAAGISSGQDKVAALRGDRATGWTRLQVLLNSMKGFSKNLSRGCAEVHAIRPVRSLESM